MFIGLNLLVEKHYSVTVTQKHLAFIRSIIVVLNFLMFVNKSMFPNPLNLRYSIDFVFVDGTSRMQLCL